MNNTNISPLLTIKHLSMSFGGICALNDLNLEIPKNQITAIIGPNGAGKTTLFNCLTGFYQAQTGQLLFQHKQKIINLEKRLGQPFKTSHILHPLQACETLYYKMFGGSHKIAQMGIARTFQNIRLFKEMSVIENLLVAQHLQINRNIISGILNTKAYQNSLNQAVEKAYDWLDLFDLSKDGNRLAGELPYGKQRHLEIARSLCTNPLLICLDEPAAGLNPSETAHLSEIIIRLQKEYGLTFLLIEHDMSMIMKISDTIYVLDHGEIISHGDPTYIANDPKVIEAYLGICEDSTQGDFHDKAAIT